jgi:hypothetical protein
VQRRCRDDAEMLVHSRRCRGAGCRGGGAVAEVQMQRC